MKKITFLSADLYSTLPKPVCPPSNMDDAFVALWRYMAQKVINTSHSMRTHTLVTDFMFSYLQVPHSCVLGKKKCEDAAMP